MPQRFIRRSHKIIIHCILFTFNESVRISTDRLDILADSVRIAGTPKSDLKEAFLRKKGELKIAKLAGKVGFDQQDVLANSVRVTGTPKSNLKEIFYQEKTIRFQDFEF